MHARLRVLLASALMLSCTPGRTGTVDDGGARTDGGGACRPGIAAFLDACECEAACADATARCERNRLLEPLGASYCTVDCGADPSVCPAGTQCLEGPASEGRPFCARCANDVPGLVPLSEPCLCDADCAPGEAGERAECGEGSCRLADCLVADPSSCPEGRACEAGPGFSTFCAECLGLPAPSAEGESCGCSAECAEGLVCRRGACRRSCDIDEQCGALSCVHRTEASPSCEPPVLDCAADGSAGPGDPCECNEDCGADAPFCLLGAIGDVLVNRCAASCVPDADDCPLGTRCCGADRVLAPTCLSDDVVRALGGVLVCARG